jgi:hypothetical protein
VPATDEANHIATEDLASNQVPRSDYALRACFERLRTLKSTWSVFARIGFSTEDHYIVTTGRALSEELSQLAGLDIDSRSDDALPKIHSCLDSLECEMRTVAREVSLEQLRTTLPVQVREDRRSVLDLLDLMLASEIDNPGTSSARVATVDYVITLLCMNGGDRTNLQDPVTLTPRLFGLCELAAQRNDPLVEEVVAEFEIALQHLDATSEGTTVPRRKNQLGDLFYAPTVLRAITEFNAAEIRAASTAIESSQNWGSLPGEAAEEDTPTTVFESKALPKIAEALRRRRDGEPPTWSPIDRIAWCLDTNFPNATETEWMLSPGVGTRANTTGTAILVGLLCRSADVLADELGPIGIPPEYLTGDWVQELNDALKSEGDKLLLGNEYTAACILSDLRTKFWFGAVANVRGDERSRPTQKTAVNETRTFRKEAEQLANSAVTTDGQAKRFNVRALPLPRVGRIAVLSASALLITGLIVNALLPAGELRRIGEDELKSISLYLDQGKRTGQGIGPAFVGTLGDKWETLDTELKSLVAENMVEALGKTGVKQIMIYDDDNTLRIQALGQQPIRIFAAATY